MKKRESIEQNAQKKKEMEIVVDVYKRKGCNISATCDALKISRQTFYNWLENVPKIKDGIEEADESLIDFAETKLIEKINNGDTSCIQFYLRTKGRKRGYITQTEVAPTNSFAITVADAKAKETLEEL